MKKWLKWTLIAVPAVAIAAGAVVLFRLDAIVRSVVQTQTSQQLNVAAKLGGANVSLLGGTVKLSDFDIGSPKGFKEPSVFTLGSVAVDVTYGQLTADVKRVNNITINKPKLVIEQQGGKINLKALMDGLPASPDQPTPPPEPGAPEKPIKMIIDKLTLTEANVSIKPNIPGVPESIDIAVPTIELKDIGNADGAANGAAIKEVLMTTMSALASKAAESDKIPPELKMILEGNLKGMVDEKVKAAGKEVEKAIDQIKNDPSSVKDVGKDLQKGLGGLIPGAKKDDEKKKEKDKK